MVDNCLRQTLGQDVGKNDGWNNPENLVKFLSDRQLSYFVRMLDLTNDTIYLPRAEGIFNTAGNIEITEWNVYN